MSRWFRFYSDAIRNPKVAVLPDGDFRLWVELMSIAAENDGLIPGYNALKHLLNRRIDRLQVGVKRLINGGLIDLVEGGFEPHNWRKFQYKSDSSTERVKRFRNAPRNGNETPPDTETETEDALAKASDAEASSDKAFWDAAVTYLGQGKRSMIGRWVKDHGREETAKAIAAAQVERTPDPVSYINAVLRKTKQRSSYDEIVC